MLSHNTSDTFRLYFLQKKLISQFRLGQYRFFGIVILKKIDYNVHIVNFF